MKRWFFLLIFLSSVVTVFPQNSVLINELLNLPAPPPPNPLVPKIEYSHYELKSSTGTVEKLGDYDGTNNHGYNSRASEENLERIKDEIRRNPEKLIDFLELLKQREEDVNFVKEMYDIEKAERKQNRYWRKEVKDWLILNSPYFLDELLLKVQKELEENRDGLINPEPFFALTKFDWDRAKSLLEELLTNSQESYLRTLAKVVFYKHALEAKDETEAERWRKELMTVVEDKSQEFKVRYLALDSPLLDKDFPGRDEWYFKLFEDETLYTRGLPNKRGLSKLIGNSPLGKYKNKMLELLRSENKIVRTNAAKNLLVDVYETKDAEVVSALLSILSEPNWVNEQAVLRGTLIEILTQVKVPESVPSLLKMLAERTEGQNIREGWEKEWEVVRVITALRFQEDPRAIPSLRSLLQEIQGTRKTLARRDWIVTSLVSAILACGGYSTTEQIEAVEFTMRRAMEALKKSSEEEILEDIRQAIADAIIERYDFHSDVEVEQDLVNEMVFRIKKLEKTEPEVALAMRAVLLKWKGQAVNSLLLSDLKENKIETKGILRLLVDRKSIRENQINELFSARSSNSLAFGISSCLLEDENSYKAVFSTGDDEAKASFLACARMIRLRVPVDEVGRFLKSENKLLADAAYKYLESEDSAEARNLIYSAYPNQAIILGARQYFGQPTSRENELLNKLFESVYEGASEYLENSDVAESNKKLDKIEQNLRREVLEQEDLIGIYYYDKNYVRIYKDKVIFSLEKEGSVYYERKLKPEEFKKLTSYLSETRASDLPPFLLSCLVESCSIPDECIEGKELVMIGKNGGRRVYWIGDGFPAFFRGLDDIFEDFQKAPNQMQYRMQSSVNGLQVLLLGKENLLSVWKQGNDIRLLVLSEEKYKQEEKRLEDKVEALEASRARMQEIVDVEEEFKPSGIAWMRFSNGKLEGETSQPPTINFGNTNEWQQNEWKESTPTVKLHTSHGIDSGLFKIVGGKKVKIVNDHDFYGIVISSDGRWALAKEGYADGKTEVFRINLLNGQIYPVEIDGQGKNKVEDELEEDTQVENDEVDSKRELVPLAYVPSLRKFLIAERVFSLSGCEECYEVESLEYVPDEPKLYEKATTLNFYSRFFLVNPSTGQVQPVGKEIGPLAQQTFRPLQPVSGKPDEFWAAEYDRDTRTTHVGIFNAKTLKFRSFVSIPRIKFNSMRMWVDEKEKKVYIAHVRNLISVPIP